ncbi:hypothetical protein V6N13_082274 [Hibiscus sabdariffa]|uniref:S-protein homolog n=1 Tax=Hibiscus sabdariffa TaxID=183260 RepID=A0ABR2Q2X6_9ROSI
MSYKDRTFFFPGNGGLELSLIKSNSANMKSCDRVVVFLLLLHIVAVLTVPTSQHSRPLYFLYNPSSRLLRVSHNRCFDSSGKRCYGILAGERYLYRNTVFFPLFEHDRLVGWFIPRRLDMVKYQSR